MTFESFVLLMVSLICLTGLVSIVLSHGVNGQYFRSSKSQAEAIAKLRVDKPQTALIIGGCYLLILLEFLAVVAAKFLWQ